MAASSDMKSAAIAVICTLSDAYRLLNDVIARMPYMQKATYDELLQLLPHKWKKE